MAEQRPTPGYEVQAGTARFNKDELVNFRAASERLKSVEQLRSERIHEAAVKGVHAAYPENALLTVEQIREMRIRNLGQAGNNIASSLRPGALANPISLDEYRRNRNKAPDHLGYAA